MYFEPTTDAPPPVDGGGTALHDDDVMTARGPQGQPGQAGERLPAVDGRPHVDAVVLDAYRDAAAWAARTDPSCHLHWSLLAGIGHVESHHAAGVSVSRDGDTSPSILGPQLNGAGEFAAISDTDGGRFDSDEVWDRAVGPMQFIPSSWASMGVDGNSDGVADPNNVYDAAAGSARYLCNGDRDLAVLTDRKQAVFGYNHSWEYVSLVLRLTELYANGRLSVASRPLAPVVAVQAGTSGGRTGGVVAAPASGLGGTPASPAGPRGDRNGQRGEGPGAGPGGTSRDGSDRGGRTGAPDPSPSPHPSPEPTTPAPEMPPSEEPTTPAPETTTPGLCYSDSPDAPPASVEDAMQRMACAVPCPQSVADYVAEGLLPDPSLSPEGTEAVKACEQQPQDRGFDDDPLTPAPSSRLPSNELVCWTNEQQLWCVVEVPPEPSR